MSYKIKKRDLKFSIFIIAAFFFFSNINIVFNSKSLFAGVRFVILPLFAITAALCITRKVKIYTVTMLIELAYSMILLATLISGRSIRNAISVLLPVMAMMLLFNYGIERKEEVFLAVVRRMMLAFVLINAITVVLAPNGLFYQDGPNWLFGLKNVHVRYIIPGIAIIIAADIYKKGKLTLGDYALLGVGIINNLLVKSSTGLAGMLLFSALIISDNFRGKISRKIIRKMLNPTVIVLVSIVLYYFVLSGGNSILGTLVSKYFGKDLTFTGRSYVWARCLELILQKPMFGYGYVNSDEFFSLIGVGIGAHPHNYLLAWLFYGGVFSLVFVAMAYFVLIKRVKKNTSVQARVYLWATISFFVMGVTDVSILSVLMHPMLLLCEYYSKNDRFRM